MSVAAPGPPSRRPGRPPGATSSTSCQAVAAAEELLAGVRTRLDETGMSQADIARTMGVSRAQVARLLAVGANPTLRSLTALAAAVGLHVGLVPVTAVTAVDRDT